METIQAVFKRQVEGDESMAIGLKCGNCGGVRTFIIQENLKLLINKEHSALEIDTECQCGRIAVTIGWHKNEKGYSYRPISKDAIATAVTDDTAMKEEIG